MGGVDRGGKRIGPMQMTRLIGAKSWLRGRSCALPTLDRRRRMPAQPSGF